MRDMNCACKKCTCYQQNPLDTGGIICDFCGNGGAIKLYTISPTIMIGNIPRSQFVACPTCTILMDSRDIQTLAETAGKLVPVPLKAVGVAKMEFRKKVRRHFLKLYGEIFQNLVDSRKLEPSHIFDLHVARATSKHRKCEFRTGHLLLGSCADIAYFEVDAGNGWRKGCLVCITQVLGFNRVNEIIGSPRLRELT